MSKSLSRLTFAPYLLCAVACPSDQPATTESGSTGGTETSSSTSTDPGTSTSTGPEDPTTSTTSSTTDPVTTTSTGPAPAVCGNGVVEDLEPCDDGNDEPDDGCNSKCEVTGAILWTYTFNGADSDDDVANAVTVDSTGRVIIAGSTTNDPMNRTDGLVIVLAPDGTEEWKKVVPGAAMLYDSFTNVAVDADDNIYIAGYEETMEDASNATVHAFAPDGAELWVFSAPGPEIDYATSRGIAVTADGLYSSGSEDLLDAGTQMFVRRHDPGTGEEQWKVTTQADTLVAFSNALAVVGSDVISVGYTYDDKDTRPLIVVVSDNGALVSAEAEEHLGGIWRDVKLVGDAGDLILSGRRVPRGVTGADIGVRRVGPDFSEKWTQTFDLDFLYDSAAGVAVGPDESLFVSGQAVKMGELSNIYGGRFAADGTPKWTHIYDNPDIHIDDVGNDAAFGPDFMVLAGFEIVLGEGANVWVRAFKAD